MVRFVIFIGGLCVRHFYRVLSRRIEDAALRYLSVLRRTFSNMDVRYANRAFVDQFCPFSCQGDRVLLDRIAVRVRRFLYFHFYFLTNHVDHVSFLPRRLHDARRRANARLPPRGVYPLIARSERIAVKVGPILVYAPGSYLEYETSGRFFFRFNDQVCSGAQAILYVLRAMIDGCDALFNGSFCILDFATGMEFQSGRQRVDIRITNFLGRVIRLALRFLPGNMSMELSGRASARE